MTLRAKPTSKPVTRPRRGSGGDHRGSLYVNIAFMAVIVFAILLFAGAAFASWYDDHFAAAATVNGVNVTKDQVAQRIKIETFRLKRLEDRTRQRASQGRIPGSQATSIITYIDSIRSNLEAAAVSYETDSELIRQLAAKQGIAISEADIDAQFRKDATAPESRHTYVITIKPEVSAGAKTADEKQKTTAREKAAKLLAGLRSGTSWEDTVKASGDPDAAAGDGDLYYVEQETTSPDRAFVEAVFALPANGLTEVIEGADGAFRIGRVTDIVAAAVDPNFEQQLRDASVDVGAYRLVDKAYVARDKIEAKLVAEVVDNPSEQRRVVRLDLDANGGQPAAAGSVLARHILYSPNDSPDKAKALDAKDPAWDKAKKEADEAFAKLDDGSASFVDLVTRSDDSGSAASNGFLGWQAEADSQFVAEFKAALFKPGVSSGQVLEPVKTEFGYHVIQIVSTESPDAYVSRIAAEAAKPGVDLARLAADHSTDAETGPKGGDMGWVAKYQLDAEEEATIFALLKGGVSAPIPPVPGDSVTSTRIYVVADVQTRAPDDAQKRTLRDSVFSNWYAAVRADPAQADIVEAP